MKIILCTLSTKTIDFNWKNWLLCTRTNILCTSNTLLIFHFIASNFVTKCSFAEGKTTMKNHVPHNFLTLFALYLRFIMFHHLLYCGLPLEFSMPYPTDCCIINNAVSIKLFQFLTDFSFYHETKSSKQC